MTLEEKTKKAVKRIEFAYEMAISMGNSLIVAYSGGK